MRRTIHRSAVLGATLALSLLLGAAPTVAPAQGCTGNGCQASTRAKPLNLMRFMGEKESPAKAHKSRPAHRHSAAQTRRTKPQAPETSNTPDAAAVQMVTGDEVNAIDRAAESSVSSEHAVQMVGPEDFNAIDQKADDTAPAAESSAPDINALSDASLSDGLQTGRADALAAPAVNSQTGDAESTTTQSQSSSQSEGSWMRWIWSALEATVTAFATAIHALIG
jgi:hypothetical protein